MTVGEDRVVKTDSEEEKEPIHPEGWKLSELCDLLEVKYGKGLPKNTRKPNGVPVYGSNGIIGQHTIPLTKGPAIIIGRKGTVGAVHFSDVPCWPIDTTYFIDEFQGIDPAFIVYALRSINLPYLDTSTAIPGLNREDLYNQKIPLPPIEEQKRIVAKLEELLPRVNAVRERLIRVKGIMKRFRQSVLSAACSGRLTVSWRDENLNVEPAGVLFNSIEQKREREYVEECRRAKAEKRRKPSKWTNLSQELHAENVEQFASIPSNWIYIPLGKVAGRGTDSIVDGPFGTSINVKTDYTNGGVPVVRINNIRAFSFLPDDLRFVSELKYQQLIRHCILPGDVLLTKVGTIGESCAFPDSYVKAMLSTTGSCRIRVDAELANNKYICIYLNFLKWVCTLLNRPQDVASGYGRAKAPRFGHCLSWSIPGF